MWLIKSFILVMWLCKDELLSINFIYKFHLLKVHNSSIWICLIHFSYSSIEKLTHFWPIKIIMLNVNTRSLSHLYLQQLNRCHCHHRGIIKHSFFCSWNCLYKIKSNKWNIFTSPNKWNIDFNLYNLYARPFCEIIRQIIKYRY